MTWLPQETFTIAVNALPLVSVDLCIADPDGRLLVGLRTNRPAQGWWFTPGGRVRKNEPIGDAIVRVAQDEIGLTLASSSRATLMGAWDHFYPDSAFSPDVSTHYVNLPHLIVLDADEARDLGIANGDPADGQHSHWRWISLAEGQADPKLHHYARNYLEWLNAAR